MELSWRLKNALIDLESPDLESRIRAVEDLAACSSAIAEHVAAAFEREEEAPHLITERMGRFGSLMIALMERVYREAGDEKRKLLSAAALLYMGSDVGVPSLLAATRAGSPDLCLAAAALSSAGVSEAVEPIENALLECELSDVKTLECLTASLRGLKHAMPETIRLRLSKVEPKWLRDSLLS
ncbi:hypothetical protein ACFV5J_26285 [Streptomyces zaomyceticus]|uniref:hypothetical protein n=1 Tax=Streptomyces zaomyceticus TaxID=68286 RepID=UPI00365B7787